MPVNRKPEITFIGHEASLSGAPILLLNLLRLFKSENVCKINLCINRDGPLVEEYRKDFNVLVLKNVNYSIERNLPARARNFISNKLQLIALLKMVWRSDLVFSNTIVNGKVLRVIAIMRKKIITYVHELENVIDRYIQYGDASWSLRRSTLYAYPSLKVRNTLVLKYGIHEQVLLPLNYYFPVDTRKLNDSDRRALVAKSFRKKYGIEKGEFIVGGMGLASKRKGTDLFIRTGLEVIATNPSVRFCWIGGFENEQVRQELMDLIPAAFSRNFVFTGILPHEYFNFAAFDIFFLSSREDPYPLVVLEAAMLGLPSLCFADSGGITEFVSVDAGWILPDMNACRDLIWNLMEDRTEIIRKGLSAYQKVLALHANPALVIQQFNQLLINLEKS